MATTETVKIVFDVDSKELTDTTKELVTLGKVVDDDVAKFKKLNAESGNSEKSFTSLRAQVRQAKEEVQRLSDEFGEFSAEANAARVKAGQLADQMSDLNRQVNLLNPEAKARAFVNFGQGVVGAFQVATGALQAFGAENEEVQKIAQKLQGALNVVQGIASIKALKESYQDIKVVLGVTTAAQNTLNAATVGGGAAATGAATGFRALTAAMVANPFTAIAVAIGAIAGALFLMSKNSDEAAKKSQDLLDLEKQFVDLADERVKTELRIRVARGEITEDEAKSILNQKQFNQSLDEQQAKLQKLREENAGLLFEYETFVKAGKEADFFAGYTDEAGDVIRQIQQLEKNIVQESKLANESIIADQLETLNKQKQEAKKTAEEITKKREEEAKKAADAELKALLDNQAKIDAARASQEGLRSQFEQELANQLGEIDKQAALEKEANLANYYGQEKVLRDLNLITEQQAIDKKLEKLKEFGDTSSKEYQALLAKRTQLNKESEDNQTKDTEEGEKDRKKIREENLKISEELFAASADFIYTLQAASFQKEQDDLAAQKEQGIITEEQYQEKLKAIKIKQAKANKEAAIFQATTDFALALINALTFKPANAVPAALIATTAIAGLNLAKVIATPLPKFKEGTLNFQGGNIDGDGGALAVLHPNEAVIPADRNKAYHPTLEAIYKKQIKPSELNAFVLNKLAGKGGIGRDTQITANVDTYSLSRALSRNKGVEVTNAQMIGAAVASELSKRINPRQVL